MKIKLLQELHNVGGVLCHGCFDLVHIGHIRHLIAAKKLVPEGPLTVTITADRFIDKGPGRPVFPAAMRVEWLAALACVDYVAVVEEATGVSAILAIKPQYYVKGRDYAMNGVIPEEHEAIERVGGRMVYLHSGDQYSSTGLLNSCLQQTIS